MNYAEMLKHPKWQKRRLERLEAADFTCRRCKSKDNTLHVHHTTYRRGRMLWDYDDRELIVVCMDCHVQVEGERDELQRIVGELDEFQIHELIGYAHALHAMSNGRRATLSGYPARMGAIRCLSLNDEQRDKYKSHLDDELFVPSDLMEEVMGGGFGGGG